MITHQSHSHILHTTYLSVKWENNVKREKIHVYLLMHCKLLTNFNIFTNENEFVSVLAMRHSRQTKCQTYTPLAKILFPRISQFLQVLRNTQSWIDSYPLFGQCRNTVTCIGVDSDFVNYWIDHSLTTITVNHEGPMRISLCILSSNSSP